MLSRFNIISPTLPGEKFWIYIYISHLQNPFSENSSQSVIPHVQRIAGSSWGSNSSSAYHITGFSMVYSAVQYFASYMAEKYYDMQLYVFDGHIKYKVSDSTIAIFGRSLDLTDWTLPQYWFRCWISVED